MTTPMTLPLWVLLAFAAWTLAVLLGSVGVYRWARILTGRATLAQWRADVPQGCDWYQRAMRAHMNCVENLPVYAVVAVTAALRDVQGRELDVLALAFLAARIGQSLVHIALPPTETAVALRFGLYLVQIAGMFAMGTLVALHA